VKDKKGSNPPSIEEKPVRKPLKLTLKQRRWLKEYFKTGNATRAALKAYDTKNYSSASVIANENLEKLKPRLRTLMEKHGLSLGTLIVKLGEGLEAKKIHGTKDDFIEVEDYAVRHKYLETAAKWLGIEEAQEKPVSSQFNQFNFYNIPPEELKEYQKRALKAIKQ